ncbi:MAG TPA: catalase family peroxidase [Verrucomicrobiae bacterium]|nr:catalase family peroxidase [Verrucomicrobiae bacterium]
MTPAKTDQMSAIVDDVLSAFDDLNGPQPGYRPAHAKGILLAGRFVPSPEASSLTRAPHIRRISTPVTVRFSDATGLPNIPDNDANASPRGMAIRFHLEEHVHTDIIGHSVDGFPVRTADEFVELLRAVRASGPDAATPKPIERFLAAHPAALEFVQAPKPIPASFFKESFYSVNALRFINADGASQYGRYRVRPEGANEYLDDATAAKRAPDFLFDDVRERLALAPAKMRIAVQIAAAGDIVDDSTVHWPKDRREVPFGTIELTSVQADNDAAQRHIIFDPIPRVEGIEPSGDPLLDPRANIYLMSGRRRRAGGPR